MAEGEGKPGLVEKVRHGERVTSRLESLVVVSPVHYAVRAVPEPRPADALRASCGSHGVMVRIF